ncbi:hypothetical protein FA15DRAFT_671530 [Coprinopsis marcescibilis]|uniref:F-box domain-containing protein n=1 Tax=Coprinopsis marcescibilis TaxID=230819 RepID=A0A5C3KPU0_COPMA|nr:hypothetical protein FA15DRAFT_671530 [Coprinopsis marcescibilis]
MLSTVTSDVLSNEDLLDCIFNHLVVYKVNGYTSYDTRSQLLCLALTCRTFRETALNLLWACLPGVLPLYRLLSNFVLLGDVWVFNGAISDEDWQCAERTGRRVRAIIMTPQERPPNPISPFAHQVISLFVGPRLSSFLPNVKTLRVVCSPQVDYPSALFALSASLEVVELKEVGYANSQGTDLDFFRAFIVAIASKAKSLRVLHLHGNLDPSVMGPLSYIGLLTKLTNLTIRAGRLSIPTAFIRTLGRLPELSSITMNARNISPDSTLPSTSYSIVAEDASTHPIFPSLSYLQVGGSAEEITLALSSILLSTVKHVCLVTMRKRDPQTHLENCFRTLAEGSPNLQVVQVTQTNRTTMSLDITFSLPVVSPLFEVKSITSLSINAGHISGSNGFVAALAAGLPNLTYLALPACPGRDNPDLRCLKSIATHCCRLMEVRISLNLGPVECEESKEDSPRGRKHHPLSFLYINDSAGDQPFTVNDSILMAKFLYCLFPRIQACGLHRNSRGEGRGGEAALREIFQLYSMFKNPA